MHVIVNGADMICPEASTIQDLACQLGLSPERLVVERNREIVPAAEFAVTILEEGDVLELLQFVGGG